MAFMVEVRMHGERVPIHAYLKKPKNPEKYSPEEMPPKRNVY
jgi:hypothetical protein